MRPGDMTPLSISYLLDLIVVKKESANPVTRRNVGKSVRAERVIY